MSNGHRFVFAAHGTWGDVGPMVHVARRLVEAGHEVRFISTPYFETKIRERGLSCVSVGAMWDPEEGLMDARLRDPLTGPLNIWRLVFEPLLEPMFDACTAALDGKPGVVVVHPWCLGAQLAAAARGVPWSVVVLAPVTWFSVEDVPISGPIHPPAWMSRFLMRHLVHRMIRGVFGASITRVARARGLEPTSDPFFDATRNAALNLAFWPEVYRGPVADDPPNALLCGFPDAGRPAKLEPALEEFLAAGPPPIVMGLGSALPRLGQHLYTHVAEACRELGQRVVLVGAAEGSNEPGVMRVPWAPYSALFRRAAMNMHHGGIGSTAEALVAGRPQFILPFGADQFDNANRVRLLGVGESLHSSRSTPRRLLAALRRCLERMPQMTARAREIAAQLEPARPGVDVAAEALIELASR